MGDAVRPPGVRDRRPSASGDEDGFLHLHRLRPGGPVPAVRRAFRVHGALDRPALRHAWAAVVARHDSLRAVFTGHGGVTVRHVAGDGRNDLRELDAGEEASPPAVTRWCERLAADLPDPGAEPAVRLSVVRFGAGIHLLVLSAHRLAADERSADVLLGELSQAYAAARAGQTAVLPAPVAEADQPRPPGPYDLAVPPALDLPTGPPADGWATGRLAFRWDEAVARPVGALARAERVEPGAVVVAAFQALLHRYSRAARIAVGVTGRRTGQAVGCFAGLRIATADLTGQTSLRALLRAGREHHRPPLFGDLVRAVAAGRDLSRHALLDAAVEFASPPARLRLAGTTVWPLATAPGPATGDLTLTVRREQPVLDGELVYREGLFTGRAAELILGQLRTLLAAGLAAPGDPIGTLPLGAAVPVLAADDTPAVGVHHDFGSRVKAAPHAPAIVTAGSTRTYAELAAQAAGIAAALRGTGAGDTVIVRMPAGALQAATVLGVWQTGARVVCLGPGEPGDRGRAAIAGLAPHAMVIDGGGVADPLCSWFRSELDGVIVDAATVAPATPGPAPVAPGSPAYVAYTSGTTGVPKGIPMTHATLAQFTGWMAGHFQVGPGARVAQWAAPGYDASLVELFLALGSGAASYPVPERYRGHPGKVLDWLVAAEITHFQTVPSFARAMLREIVTRGRAPGALRHLLLAGEQLSAELAEGLRVALPGARLVNLYGPTETILATFHDITGPVHGRTPIGRPIPGRDVLVLDPHDRPCPPGVAGELVIASRHVTAGYVGAADGHEVAFRPPAGAPAGLGWYRTGDIGRFRWDGPLECLGRRDEQIKFHGIRLEVTDIEAVLAACSSVGQCVVTPVTDHDGLVVRLVAYVVPAEPGEHGTDELRAHLRRRFGAAMPPVSFRFLSGLPRTAGGKVDRRRLLSSRG